jgi:protein arginine N-methyltransferase 5
MFSWFPILFPLREPIQLKKGDTLTLHFWRLVSKKSVWYEWSISDPVSTPVHNPNGRSYEIGL